MEKQCKDYYSSSSSSLEPFQLALLYCSLGSLSCVAYHCCATSWVTQFSSINDELCFLPFMLRGVLRRRLNHSSILHRLQGDTFKSQHKLQAGLSLLFHLGVNCWIGTPGKGEGVGKKKWHIPTSSLWIKTSGFAFAGYNMGSCAREIPGLELHFQCGKDVLMLLCLLVLRLALWDCSSQFSQPKLWGFML